MRLPKQISGHWVDLLNQGPDGERQNADGRKLCIIKGTRRSGATQSRDGIQLTDDGYKHFVAFQKLKSARVFSSARFVPRSLPEAGLIYLERIAPVGEGDCLRGPLLVTVACMAAIGQSSHLKEFRTWHTAQTQAGERAPDEIGVNEPDARATGMPSGGKESPASFHGSTLATVARIKNARVA